MGRKLLIVASKRYGDYVKEIAESMGCFEEISFDVLDLLMYISAIRTGRHTIYFYHLCPPVL